jgi:hypothetical protein
MRRPSAARIFLCLGFFQTWVINAQMTAGLSELPHAAGLGRIVPLDWMLTTPGWLLFSAFYLGSMVAFAARWREDQAGWLLMGLTAIEVGVEMSVRRIFMPHLEAMLSGGLLLSWLLARAWGRRRALEGEALDALGHEVVAGTFGAMMTLAACSKLWLSGLLWLDGPTHCATVYEHELLNPGSPWSPIRRVMVSWSWLCALGAGGALVIELAGVAMIWPELRKVYAVAVVWLFLSLSVFYGIEELSWVTMACALAWSRLGEPRRG